MLLLLLIFLTEEWGLGLVKLVVTKGPIDRHLGHFLNENCYPLKQIPPIFIPEVLFEKNPALVWMIIRCIRGDGSLSEPMVVHHIIYIHVCIYKHVYIPTCIYIYVMGKFSCILVIGISKWCFVIPPSCFEITLSYSIVVSGGQTLADTDAL